MTITIDIPKFVSPQFGDTEQRLEDDALETFVCALYREERLSAPDAMRWLQIPTRIAFDAVLKRHNAHREWSEQDIADELESINRYGNGQLS